MNAFGCAYCGGVFHPDETNCASCGSRLVATTGDAVSKMRVNGGKWPFLAILVWLLLGVFGGYAYWYGNKTKAYVRVALWLTSIGWATLGVVAKKSGDEVLSSFYAFPFFATMLLIFLLWIFDLAHILRKSKLGH